MKKVIQELLIKFSEINILYCHWKSNINIDNALNGYDDLDLLISIKDTYMVEMIFTELNIKKAIQNETNSHDEIKHFYALDAETGILIHLHVFYSLITGYSLVKNHKLPFDIMLLKNAYIYKSILVPNKSAEIIVFTFRMIIKHSSIIEILLLKKTYHTMLRECLWLKREACNREIEILLKKYFPVITIDEFNECLALLEKNLPIIIKYFKFKKKVHYFNAYKLSNDSKVFFLTVSYIIKMLLNKMLFKNKNKELSTDDKVIAITGGDASGKTTITKNVYDWLKSYFKVRLYHLGKPSTNILTCIPNLMISIGRVLTNNKRIDKRNDILYKSSHHNKNIFKMIYYVILAYDRAKMIEKIRKNAKNGCVIICDRYPSKTIGAMDSPRLSIEDCTGWFITIKNMLVNVENRLYDTMGTPDILIKIFVPIDIALSRNKNRTVPGIKENDKEIRLRHLEFHKMDYGDTKTFHVLNDKEIDSTVREIREIIWTHLS